MAVHQETNIGNNGEGRDEVHLGMSSVALATIIKQEPRLSERDIRTLNAIDTIDWEKGSLDLSQPTHQDFAARALALGRPVFYGFGNFYALAARPDFSSVLHVNLAKGRPANQVGSITTTREHFADLFAWERLPDGLQKDTVLAVMDAFYEQGPFGFRGPAVDRIPEHLVSRIPETQLRTTQLIAPGYACPSNRFLEKALDLSQNDHLFITSANISKNRTGQEEAAHYRIKPLQIDFGQMTGFVMLRHADEEQTIARYAEKYTPMSTSILGFHELHQDATGRPALVVERHGSLPVEHIADILHSFGFGFVLSEKAKTRLPARNYSPQELR